VITDVDVSVTYSKVPGACGKPGVGDARNSETSLGLKAPDGTLLTLAKTGTWNSPTAVFGVTVKFDDAAASAPTIPASIPVSGTFKPGNRVVLRQLNGRSPLGTWRLMAGSSQTPLCIESYSIKIATMAGQLTASGL
jgi:hypothetical protein